MLFLNSLDSLDYTYNGGGRQEIAENILIYPSAEQVILFLEEKKLFMVGTILQEI